METINLIGHLVKTEIAYNNILETCFDQAPDIFKQTRKQFGWSQRKLAKLLDCDHTYISKIENSRLKPGKPILKKLGRLINEEKDKSSNR